MTTKTEQIPDDVKKYVDIVIDDLRRKLELGDFTMEITYDNIKIKIPDINAYIDNKKLYIMYKDIDILYSDYIAIIKVFKDPYRDPDIYRAHEYWGPLDELHALALEKVKGRLEKILSRL
jgi:hypothetical protein